MTDRCFLPKSYCLLFSFLGSGTPKPSTPTPTNTPCSTPHPVDIQGATPSVTPTPQDPTMPQQQTLLAPFSQQQMALPVMTIPLPTSISTGTTSSQVMTNPAGLNFINVVGSVWYNLILPLFTLSTSPSIFFFSLDLFAAGTTGQYLIYHSAEYLFYAFSLHIKYSLKYTVYVSMFLSCVCVCVCVCLGHSSPQTLMAGSNPMLGCSPGINLSGILPSGGLMPSALPTMQPAASAGIQFPFLTHVCWKYLPCLWFA